MLSSVENDGQSDIQHFLGKYTIKFQMLYALNRTKKKIHAELSLMKIRKAKKMFKIVD